MSTHGWQKVFKFTFIQQLKSKSFIISSVLICTLIFAMMVLLGLLPSITGDDNSSDVTGDITIKKIYVIDNSGITEATDYTDAFKSMNVEVITAADSAEAEGYSELVKNGTACLLLTFEKQENYVSIYAGRPADESVTSGEANHIAAMAESVFNYKRLEKFGLDEGQISTALAPTSTDTSVIGEKAVNPVVEAIKSMVPMLSSLVLFILIIVYGQLVAQSIALEKTSKVMELLLTSVRPLAVIIGKILAMCSVSLMQFLIFVAAGAVGFLASMPFGIFAKIDDIVSAVSESGVGIEAQNVINDIMSAFSSVNIGTLVILIITFILGFLVYALIAGLAGASISKMEDLSAAIQPMSIIGVLGFYLAYMPQIGNTDGESNIISVIARYIPISSPFCLPSAYMLGQMTLVEVIIALAILLVCVIILALIVAKVYEHIILHTGDRLKLADMLKMSESAKKTEKK